MNRRVYLDHNASTPVHPEVLQIMLPYFSELYGNASSIHSFGREARDAVEAARAGIAGFLGARDDEVVFTSGGTESDNLAVKGVAQERGIPFHVDGVQAVGKIPLSVHDDGISLLSASSHKMYGPKGIGALYIRKGTKMISVQHGGDHERRRRAGTENVPAIVGFAK